MQLGIPNMPARNSNLQVVIQDRTDLPVHLRPKLRVTQVDASAIYEFTGKTISRWTRWLRRIMRFGKIATLIAIAALAQQLQAQHGIPDQHMPLIIGTITSAISTSAKVEAWTATHNLTNSTGDAVKCALFTNTATLGAATTSYSTTNEITGTGYTAGGVAMANATPTSSGTTAILDWADASWTTATFSADGCQTYNSSKSNKSLFVIAFGSTQSVTAGTFTIQWPTADASNAILRF